MRRRHFLRTTLAAAATGLAARSAGTPNADARAVGEPRLPATGPAAAGPLRLNSNENALGPSEGARRAIIEALGEANRYTHRVAAELRPRLAEHHDVPEAAIVFGNGSTEVLQMAVQAMAVPGARDVAGDVSGGGPGDILAGGRRPRLVVPDPTFEHVEDYAAPWGLELVKVPLTASYAHDVGRMRDAAREAARAGRPVLAYVCNPNNPTGSLTPSADVEAWIEEADDVVFLVDEAYFEYVDDARYRSALPLAMTRPNVVVVRTFSKIHGLAGLRLGYALAHPDTARRIAALRANSNLNVMGLRAAGASLTDRDHRARSVAANVEARRITTAVLDDLGLEWIPTHANFLMHRVPGDLETYIDRMREHDAWVGRPFPPMLDHNRLSFGTPAEMERFADLLRDFRGRGWV